jgi:L-lactate dehydrogenase complex protein LldG
MSTARAEILGRIRGALADVPSAERTTDVPVARDYRLETATPCADLVTRFEECLLDYHATVRRVAPTQAAATIADACSSLGLDRLAAPPGLPGHWRPPDVEVIEDRGLEVRELDAINAALTGCAVAIAETGTLALDGQERSGRRALTLVPDHHICVVEAGQIVGLVAEAFASLSDAVRERRAPITLISGPSATSDIELTRVEGVHGPRHLVVVILA